MCMFCKLLFVLFFFCPLCCLFFFDIRILITPLVSSNSSYPEITCRILQSFQKFDSIFLFFWNISYQHAEHLLFNPFQFHQKIMTSMMRRGPYKWVKYFNNNRVSNIKKWKSDAASIHIKAHDVSNKWENKWLVRNSPDEIYDKVNNKCQYPYHILYQPE
jgi:hypothetical protein